MLQENKRGLKIIAYVYYLIIPINYNRYIWPTEYNTKTQMILECSPNSPMDTALSQPEAPTTSTVFLSQNLAPSFQSSKPLLVVLVLWEEQQQETKKVCLYPTIPLTTNSDTFVTHFLKL